MKIKILNKILAIIFATTTVMTMPGLTNAIPTKKGKDDKTGKTSSEFLKKKRGRSNNNVDDSESSESSESLGSSWLDKSLSELVREDQLKKAKLEEEKLEKEKLKQQKLKEEKLKHEKLEAEEIKEDVDFALDGEISKFGSLLKKFSNAESEKKELKSAFENLIKCYFQKSPSAGRANKLIKTLEACLENESAKPEIAQAITLFASKGGLKDCHAKQIRNLLDILKECSKNISAQVYVVWAVEVFASEKLLKNFSAEQVIEITNLLRDCGEYNYYAKVYVARAISQLALGGFLKGYSAEQVDSVVGTLYMCSSDDFIPDILSAFGSLANMNLLNGQSAYKRLLITNCILKFLDSKKDERKIWFAADDALTGTLVDCKMMDEYFNGKNAVISNQLVEHSPVGRVEEGVARLIAIFAKKGLFAGQSADKMWPIIKKLSNFEKPSSQKNVVEAIGWLASSGCLDSYDFKQIRELTTRLARCFSVEDAKKSVSFAISELTEKNILNHYSTTCVLNPLKDSLSKLLEDNEARNCLEEVAGCLSKSEKFKKYNVEQILNLTHKLLIYFSNINSGFDPSDFEFPAQWLAIKDSFKGCCFEEALQMSKVLCEGVEDENVKMIVAAMIGYLSENNLLGQYPSDKIINMRKILENYKQNCDCKKHVATIIKNIVKSDHLRDDLLNVQNQVNFLVTTLNDCVNVDAAKSMVAKAAGKLAEKKCLVGEDFSQIEFVLDILIKCLKADCAKNDVAHAMKGIVEGNFLDSKDMAQMVKALDILSKCSKDDSTKKYVVRVIGEMAERNLFGYFDTDRILNVTRVLAECFSQEDAKKHVLNVVSSLKDKGCFENLSESGRMEIEKDFYDNV